MNRYARIIGTGSYLPGEPVGNTALIKKIYFPREIFPVTAVLTKLVELGINFVILAALMAWYGMLPTTDILWVPLIILYTVLAALTISGVITPLLIFLLQLFAGVVQPVIQTARLVLVPMMLPRHRIGNAVAISNYDVLGRRAFATLNYRF